MKRIEELHQTSYKGLIYLLKERKKKYKGKLFAALFFSLAILIYLLFFSNDYIYSFLNKSVDLVLSFFPNLLGFSLGGLAIVAGFPNSELLKKSSKMDEISIYQILYSNFSLVILIQILITTIAFFLKWFVALDLSFPPCCVLLYKIVNAGICGLLVLLSAIILILTPTIVVNLFTLSQINSIFYTIEKAKEDKKASANNTGESKESQDPNKPV